MNGGGTTPVVTSDPDESLGCSDGLGQRHHTLGVRRGGRPTERQRFGYKASDLAGRVRI